MAVNPPGYLQTDHLLQGSISSEVQAEVKPLFFDLIGKNCKPVKSLAQTHAGTSCPRGPDQLGVVGSTKRNSTY